MGFNARLQGHGWDNSNNLVYSHDCLSDVGPYRRTANCEKPLQKYTKSESKQCRSDMKAFSFSEQWSIVWSAICKTGPHWVNIKSSVLPVQTWSVSRGQWRHFHRDNRHQEDSSLTRFNIEELHNTSWPMRMCVCVCVCVRVCVNVNQAKE